MSFSSNFKFLQLTVLKKALGRFCHHFYSNYWITSNSLSPKTCHEPRGWAKLKTRSWTELWLRLFDTLLNKRQFLLTFSLRLFLTIYTLIQKLNIPPIYKWQNRIFCWLYSKIAVDCSYLPKKTLLLSNQKPEKIHREISQKKAKFIGVCKQIHPEFACVYLDESRQNLKFILMKGVRLSRRTKLFILINMIRPSWWIGCVHQDE